MTNERSICDKTKKNLNRDKHKKSNCVQLKNIFFLQNSKTQIMTMQKISRLLEPQHLAAEMYSVQSFIVCKVKNKIRNNAHSG